MSTAIQLSTRSDENQGSQKLQKSRSIPVEHAGKVGCFAEGVTRQTVFNVVLNVILTIFDYGFDIFMTYTFFMFVEKDS